MEHVCNQVSSVTRASSKGFETPKVAFTEIWTGLHVKREKKDLNNLGTCVARRDKNIGYVPYSHV